MVRRILTTQLLLALVILTAQPALSMEPPTRLPAVDRLAAMADWHGDLDAARHSLRLAGAIDEHDHWIGGDLVVVQTGDQLDRGDQERAILDLIQKLRVEATEAGGALHVLCGNHEIMNAQGDFRYVTDGGWQDFADIPYVLDEELAAYPEEQRGRVAAFRPGGPYATMLAEQPVALIIGRDLFVHGGLRPSHVEYGFDRVNRETRAWLLGQGTEPAIFEEKGSPIWARDYSDAPDQDDCTNLASVLEALDCDRMFVGHTIQDEGIAPWCSNQVWCLDTGASAHYGGSVQIVEITPGGVTVR